MPLPFHEQQLVKAANLPYKDSGSSIFLWGKVLIEAKDEGKFRGGAICVLYVRMTSETNVAPMQLVVNSSLDQFCPAHLLLSHLVGRHGRQRHGITHPCRTLNGQRTGELHRHPVQRTSVNSSPSFLRHETHRARASKSPSAYTKESRPERMEAGDLMKEPPLYGVDVDPGATYFDA